MSNFDPHGGNCDNCNKYRSLRDGLCHECEQADNDASVIVDENGDEWVPGGIPSMNDLTRFVRPGIEFTDFANRKWEVEQVLATSAICHRIDPGPKETRAFPITSILIYLGRA